MTGAGESSAGSLRARLLDWYETHRRDLPWRTDPTPYRVLVSEFMLQQTRVDTVLRYYEPFLERFPHLEALAKAPISEVLTAWQGLGYYRRARNLHRAAKAAGVRLPETAEGLRELPGVGAYTAGAVASIAFGQPVPAIDGNVERVVSRLDGVEESPRRKAGREVIHARVAQVQDPARASEVTQALMELGAMVCTPRNPRCGCCPWRDACIAFREDRVHELPVRAERRPPKRLQGVAVVRCSNHGQVLLGRRPPGLLGGLWEPPWHAAERSEVTLDAPGEARSLADRVGSSEEGALESVGSIVHVLTHRRIELEVFVAREDGDLVTPEGGTHEAWCWARPEASTPPRSKLAERILSAAWCGWSNEEGSPLLAADPARH